MYKIVFMDGHREYVEGVETIEYLSTLVKAHGTIVNLSRVD